MASRYAQPNLTDSAKLQLSQQKMFQDADLRSRWDELRRALVLRYQSPAEAFVAFGGRTDKVLVLGELDRALREVRERVRTVRPPVSIDVEGLMADIIKLFPKGLAFEDFVEYLNWHQAKKPPSPKPQERSSRQSVLRSSTIAGKANSSGTPKPKVMAGAAATALRGSRDLGHNFYMGPLSGGVLSAQWKGSKGPPAHWMTKQRQAASRQAAENVFSDNKTVLRQMKLERKMKVLTDTEERLRAMLEEPQPPEAKQEEDKPLIIPVDFEEEQEPAQKENTPLPQLSKQGKDIQERLSSIDALVTEQKLSLAETERNILKRERQDLHAQIRQMDAMHRQSQMEMQRQMKEQMESLMETFHNVGKVMLGGIASTQAQHGTTPEATPEAERARPHERRPEPEAQHAAATDLSPRALEQQARQAKLQREAAFERRLQSELLAPFSSAQGDPPIVGSEMRRSMNLEVDGSAECMISRRRDADDRVLGTGLVQDISSELEAAAPAVSCFPQSLRPDIGGIRSADSPSLCALKNCLVYVPVCSWYDADDSGEHDAGSVGRLARMDPVEGEDWVDEFVVEALVALRLEQVFPLESRVGWILPILVGGADPRSCAAGFSAFPWDRLKQLPSHPSLESAKVAARFLAANGVSAPETFLRLSVREVVAAVVGFAGMQLHQFPTRGEALSKIGARVAGMVAAEKSAREARAWQDGEHAELEAPHADRELRRLKRAALELFEACYRVQGVRDGGTRTLAVAALRRRGLLGDGDVEAELTDREESVEEEDAWLNVSWDASWQADKDAYGQAQVWDKFGRHWDSLERTLGGEDETLAAENDAAPQEQEEELLEPADIEDVLRRLQAAVVETHDKHSQLLQVTRDAKRLENLAGGLSEAGREALRDSGVTFADLVDMTRKDNGSGGVAFDASSLRKIGLEPQSSQADGANPAVKQSLRDVEMVEKFMMAPHLWDREGDWDAGGGVDEQERKERLREDLEALQGALKRKSAKSHGGAHAVEPLIRDDVTDDGICGTLNSLLFALGKDTAPPGSHGPFAESPIPVPAAAAAPGGETHADAVRGDVPNSEADDTAEEETAGEGGESYLDGGTEEEIGRLDKEMADYLEKLGKEDDAQQEVMQYLASGLAEVRVSGEKGGAAHMGFGDDLEAGMERKRMEASQMAMEKTMKRFEEAMSNAKRLLGGTAQKDDAEPTVGVQAGGLTTAEQEAVKLEEDMRRRAEQADALAQENLMLREQLKVNRDRGGRGLLGSRADEPEVKIHWSEAIQDKELADKYKEYGEGEDAFYVAGSSPDTGQLDDRFLKPEVLQELLSASSGEVEQPHLAWGLEQVNSLSHITRASVFETVLEERVRKSRKVLKDKADAFAKELELLRSEEAEAMATLERVKEEQAAMVKDGAKAAKGAVVLLKEREVREARERSDELTAKRKEVEGELQRLEEEEEALDWRAELEKMKEKEREECADVQDEIDRAKEEGGEAAEAKIADLTKKIARIQETWVLRRNLKEKEIEIEVLGQKMEDDEQGLRLEKKRIETAFQENANTAQEELTHSLVEMEEHVARTARGRCRPEVMSSLSGVRKVMDAVQRHRAEMALALEEEKRQERVQLKEQRRREQEAAETAKLEEEIAKARATTDMTLREKRLQLIADAVAKQRQASLEKATVLLEDAEKAVAAAAAGAEGAAQAGFHQMQLRTVDGGAKHARSFVAEAKKLLAELQSAASSAAGGAADAGNPGGGDDESSATVRERLERLGAVEQAVEAAEGALGERVREAQARVEAMQKLDLLKASTDEVKAVSEQREGIVALLKELGELDKVEEANKVRGRDLATREQRLRASWDRTAPRIEQTLRKILVKGDAFLDSVQAALKAGKVSSAVAELGNAQQAYDKFKAAKAASPAASAKS